MAVHSVAQEDEERKRFVESEMNNLRLGGNKKQAEKSITKIKKGSKDKKDKSSKVKSEKKKELEKLLKWSAGA